MQINLKDKSIRLVAYPDGGAIPNPGAAGFGVHGYYFDIDFQVDKATLLGNPFIIQEIQNRVSYCTPTTKGYESCDNLSVPKNKAVTFAKPLGYIDICDHLGSIETNNVAELHGLLQIYMFAAKNEEIKEICVLPDSKYVLDTMEIYVKSWKRNNWLKSDGIEPKNLLLIQELDQYQDALKGRGCKIEFKWVKGHSGDLGNGMADYFASIAVNAGQEYLRAGVVNNHRVKLLEEVSSDKGYWTKDVVRHPFLGFRRTYFNRVKSKNEPGHYFMIEPSETDMMIGKRANEAYSVVRLNKPCELLENVISAQGQFGQEENRVILGLMDRIYNKFTSKFSLWFGRRAFFGSANRREVLFRDMSPVALEHNPPLLIYRATEILLNLDSLLDEFLVQTGKTERDMESEENSYLCPVIEDITTEFYNVEDKKTGGDISRKLTLRPEFTVGYKNHILHKEKVIGGKVLNLKFPLVLGMDVPNRNQLKRLEVDLPNVYLLTWHDSGVTLRYAFVIDCVSGVGIWSNYFCDRIMLPV